MKLGLKICFGILPIFGASALFATAEFNRLVSPYYNIRSQVVDAGLQLSGSVQQSNVTSSGRQGE